MCLARAEYQTIRNCAAFNVTGYTAARKLNQYATRYSFNDDSLLTIHGPNRYATVTNSSGLVILIGEIFMGKIQ
jgi:hypothetical protein